MDDRYWSDFAAYYSDDMDEGCRISYKIPLGRLGLKKVINLSTCLILEMNGVFSAE